jgi:hypothetical protein
MLDQRRENNGDQIIPLRMHVAKVLLMKTQSVYYDVFIPLLCR